jgi:aminopeptidase
MMIREIGMNNPDFTKKMAELAKLVLRVGLNLQSDQRLVILAGLEAVPLVREVSTLAYRAGCELVTVFWYDESLDLIRFQNAPKDTINEFVHWEYESIAPCLARGDAYLQLTARTPDLLKDQDPELVAKAGRSNDRAYYPILNYQSKNELNWTVLHVPTSGWANKLFPGIETSKAIPRLWELIFDVCRLNQANPQQAWEDHFQNLGDRCTYMNDRQFQALHFRSPGTDLVVGLPEGHRWVGGQSLTLAGVPFSANLPTEEIYTLPHRGKVDGFVTSTKPLNYRGKLIEEFKLTFRDGQVSDLEARIGENTLRNLISTDQNADRLGEVALVPHGSPISQTGMTFYDSLYDENAAHHIALGSAYKFTLAGAESMADDEFEKAGGNLSIVHVDFMIGSGAMDVYGIETGGKSIPLMEAGEWVVSA